MDTRGVSPVPIVVDNVMVTTPGDDSVAPDTTLLATVKSAPATDVPSRSSLNVTSIVVVDVVCAESRVGKVTSTVVYDSLVVVGVVLVNEFPAVSWISCAPNPNDSEPSAVTVAVTS